MASTQTVKAWAAPKPGLHHDLIDLAIPAAPKAGEVVIKVSACGVCHSDLSLCQCHWGPVFSNYENGGQVSGHEIVGLVEAVGAEVASHKVGDRVAVGWYKDSCRTCRFCLTGRHSLCDKSVATAAAGGKGGFAEKVIVPADHAIHVPAGLSDEAAAPLLCGGITVFSPLVDHGAVGKRVGIAGIGGLGAMAVQLAKARGNVVTAISTSADKQALAKEMGADHFLSSKDAEAMKAAANSLDLIIITFNAAVDFRPYLDLLAKTGVLCFVGAVPGDVSVGVFGDLIAKQITVTGSITGGLQRIRDLLQFAADHKIHPRVEVAPFAEINQMLQKVHDNKVRFRGVLKW